MFRLAFHDSSFDQTSANGALFDRLIAWRTGSPLVHVEFVMSEGNDKAATTYSSVPGAGVRYAQIDITQPWWKVVPLPPLKDGVSAAAARYLGQKYDWMGIIGFVAPFGEHDDNDKFCSEVCTDLLQAAGLFPFVKPWCVSPGDLFRMVSSLKTA